MPQALAVLVGERQSHHVGHHRAGRQPYFAHSRITVATAIPRSSASERWERVMPWVERSSINGSENCSSGLPDRWLTTHTPCQLAGALMPVPRALVKASLAAKRLAR